MSEQKQNLEEKISKYYLFLKHKFNFILPILVIIVFAGYFYWWNLTEAIAKQIPEEIKYLTYREIFPYVNISFQYPSSLHLIQNRQKLFQENVCVDTPPPESAYYDLCQNHTFKPLISLISNEGKNVIEISDLSTYILIDNLDILWSKFLQQYFSEYSFKKQDSIPIDPNKLPIGSYARKNPLAWIYGSSNPDAPLIVFLPMDNYNGWVFVLKDKSFQKEFYDIIKSFNLNNTARLVKTDLINGKSTFIDSPLYIEGLKFYDFYNQKWLISDVEKLLIFDDREKKFNEIFKFDEIGKWLKLSSPYYLYDKFFVFDRINPNIIYSLFSGEGDISFIFKYNIQTKEKELIYEGSLKISSYKIYPPIKENLLILHSYGDASCISKGIEILNLKNRTLRDGVLYSICEGDDSSKVPFSIVISPDGIYVFEIFSLGKNLTKIYLYNILDKTRIFLRRGAFVSNEYGQLIGGEMIGTYRFRFYDNKGNPKIYNLQKKRFELFDKATLKALRVKVSPIVYNDNGFIYEKENKIYYLDYINNKVTQLEGGEILFLTNSYLISFQ
jgi:hypothetical protein